ncbi:MAG: DUF2846 domain-containing protein [Bacteroidales bacterium]|nr:DUF2846 domain-containing protein [Bacteroidales bacterium]
MFFLLGILLMLNACSPKISTSINRSYAVLDYREDVMVFGVEEVEPDDAERLGTVKVGDTGFSTDCGLDVVIDKAKMEARKIGGNAIKITKHIPPSMWGSSCHRITANILKVDRIENHLFSTDFADSSLIGADYALLHIYRQGGPGALLNFDLYLGDLVICQVKNKWKETVKIDKDGLNMLWARTESKMELPIDIRFGNEYYIRCSITMGAFVGRPKLEMVDSKTGKLEFQLISEKEK